MANTYIILGGITIYLVILVQLTACYTITEGSNYYRYCSSGYYLRITSARWYCSNDSWTVTNLVNSKCNYNTACTLYATSSWLGGDPCPGVTTYLYWADGCYSIWGNWGSWSCPGDCTTQTSYRYRACVKPNGGCGSAPAQNIACKRLGCASSSDISRTTPNDQVYYSLTTDCFVATGRTSVAFRVRASNDVHIALGSVDNATSGTHYEIVIGGWTDTQSAIRFAIGGTACVSNSGSRLSGIYFDEFWFTWTGNYVRVGTGSSPGSNTFMSCYHSTPYTVNFIWIKTGWGSTGEWRFPNDVACTHLTNSYVSISTNNPSCNGVSTYACNSGYKQVGGNTQRTCGYGDTMSGYPLVCAVSTCNIDIVFIIEASYYTSSIYSSLMTVIGDLAGSLKISTSAILAGVVTYDNIVDLEIELNDYYSASTLKSSISSLSIASASTSRNLAEALRVGFYDFFTMSKGNRFTAFRHYVLIAKTTQSGATYANKFKLNPRNQFFTIGISPAASLITELKNIAGDNSRYFQISSPDDLYPQFNTLLQKIAVCPAVTIVPVTVGCKLDIVFIAERYSLRYIKRFVAEFTDSITISSNGVRVGMVLFDSVGSTVFKLNTYTSSASVRNAIESISETAGSGHLVDKGLIQARDDVFTSAGGDRTDASNYYVFIVGPFASYPESVAKDIRSSGSNYVFAVHIGSSYQTNYQKAVDTCGDYTKYTHTDYYNNLVDIKDTVLQKITSCESVDITTPGCPLDIAFILEDTNVITATEFNEMKILIKSLVSHMYIGNTGVKVGVVTFADGATTAFPLKQYSTASGIITGITNINQGSSAYSRVGRYVDKALKHTQMNFFTTGNGDRLNAANYYIFLTHGHSAGTKAAAFGSAIRSIASSNIFIIGIAISSTYDSALLNIVDNDKYLKATDFSTLVCMNDQIISSITQCPASITPASLITPSCQLDIVFIMERTESSSHENYVFLKSFFANIAQQLHVSTSTIRIGVVTYNTHANTTIALNAYMTPTDISYQILKLSEDTDQRYLIDNALVHTKNNFFTSANGDRPSAANYYVFVIDGVRSGASIQGQHIADSWPNTVFAIDINSGYENEYRSTAGDNSRYFYASSYANLFTIESDVITAITRCPVSQPVITTDSSTTNVNASAPCLNSLIYLYPEDLTEGNDGGKDMMYLMTDYVFTIKGCSLITSWEFSHWKSGYIHFMVWRPSGSKYKLLGYNSIYVSGKDTTTFNVDEKDRIFVLEGDLIGWRSAGDNLITSGSCLGPCAEGYKASPNNVQIEEEFDWTNSGTSIGSTAYAIKACLEDACIKIPVGTTRSRSCSFEYYLEAMHARWFCSSWTYSNSLTVTSTVNSKCNYQTTCNLQATTSWLGGDPCPGHTTYLEWRDTCYSFWGDWEPWSPCPVDCSNQILVRYRACVKPSGSCGTPPAENISCKRLGCYSSSDISRTTPDNQVFYSMTTDCFVAMGRESVAFRARANTDIHIALGSEDSPSSGTHYEIIIGGWNNTQSAIRYGIGGTTCVSESGTPLSQSYFDEFWFSWNGSYVYVGTGSSPGNGTFMTCYHLTPYTINFIWIMTGWNSSGEWRFPNDVACSHVTNSYVSITTNNTSCNGTSTYACNSGFKQVAGNLHRTCGFGGILTGYPLVCSVSTCKIDIVFIVEASAYTSSFHSTLMTAIGDLAGSLRLSTSDILAGVITYDDIVDLNIDLNDYYSASTLESSITSIPISNAASTVNLAEALRVGFYDFFTLAKGNRFTALRHFVVIAKTHSLQTGAPVADQIRINLKNQLFSVGISPSASLITDLKAIAGDNSSYLEVSSPDDLYSQFNTLLQNIAVCSNITFEPSTFDCELDIVFIVERYNLRYTKRFLAELMENITVSSTGIKVGMVLFDSGASTVFRLDTHTSSESVRGAIESIVETNSTDHLVDKGLIHARDSVFTAARGDRKDASNYYVIIVGPFESYPEAVAKEIRSSGRNYIFSVHIGNQYQTEYQKAVDTCGDYTKYTNVDSYENLINIKNDVLQKITSCESVNVTTQDCQLDIVFIMEDTDELTVKDFNDMKSFFVSLVSRMIIGDTAIKVGVVTYADGAATAFPLNQYSTGNGIITGITNINQGNIAYDRGSRYMDKALKYTQMNFFTTENGDRSNASNYYILLTRGPSAGNKAAAFGSAIRSIDSSNLFIVGVNISSSVDSEFLAAVDDAKYLKAENFSVLQCINDVVVPNITQCPDSINDTSLVTSNCQLDIVFIIERTESSSHENYVFLKSFFSRIAQQLDVSSSTIRIGVVTYDTDAYTTITLDAYMTPSDISYQILKLPEGTGKRNMLDTALAYTKNKFFSAANGDRAGAANYYVLAIDGVRSGASIQAEYIMKAWPNTIFAIDINSGYEKEYRRTAGVNSRYFHAPSYANLSAVESDVIAAITKCPVPQPVITTDGSLMFADVSAPCLNSLIYLYPEDLTEGKDGGQNTMYLMTDFVYTITSCSRITSWEFSHWKSGYIDFMVWRPSGSNYKLVAYNSIYVSGKNTTTYTVVEYERIAVLDGDLIGWRSKGDNLVTSGPCLGPCAEGYKASPNNVQIGEEFDWTNSGTSIDGTAYAIKACLEDNEAIAFPTPTISAKIPDHLAVGSFVTLLEPDGADYAEVVNYTALQHPSYPNSLEFFTVGETSGQITVAKRMLKAKILNEYAILVKAKDSCNTTATATVSIETVNMPPEVLGMPNVISINEETERETVLYTTIVEDLSGDDVCCTLEGTLPKTKNFMVFGNDTGIRVNYSIMSSESPAFSYRQYNSYIVKLCCDDDEDKSTGVLIVNIKKPNKTKTYEPPDWFMMSIAISCGPIFLMAFMACFVLIGTMFIPGEVKKR
ncbi:collagen alpha-3(VI) chain isoform X1 [Magallana gigas]